MSQAACREVKGSAVCRSSESGAVAKLAWCAVPGVRTCAEPRVGRGVICVPSSSPAGSIGRLSINVEPHPKPSLCASKDPPCWLTMRWEGGYSVAAEEADAGGILSFYRRITAWRRESRAAEGRIVRLSEMGGAMCVETEGPGGAFMGLYNLTQHEAALPDGLGDAMIETERMGGSMPPRSAGVWTV